MVWILRLLALAALTQSISAFVGVPAPVHVSACRVRAVLSSPCSRRSPSGGRTIAFPRQRMAEGEAEVAAEEEGEKDPRVFTVNVSHNAGIRWSSDLSFRWVYARGVDPSGSAAQEGVKVGDQVVSINGETTVGAPFDIVMDLISDAAAAAPKDGSGTMEMGFFRGSLEELQDAVGGGKGPEQVSIRVLQEGKPEVTLVGKAGTNLRDILIENKINVYQSISRFTNCKGKQLCGTCIVEVEEGLEECTVKSVDEASTLRSNPPSYRLSCVTNVYGDVTVKIFPPIGADQWTR